MHIDDHVTREAWEASPLALLTLDAAGAVCFVNPAGLRVFARPEHELVGSNLGDLTHAFDRATLAQMLAAALAGAIPSRQEVRFVRPDGTCVTTGLSLAPGDPVGSHTVCVIRDLSSEKALRPQLLHTERMASMGLVASVVAHELNNSLTGAIGCLELLQAQVRGDAAELVETALGELQRSAQIVGDIKGYARTEEGLSERVAIDDLLRSFARMHRYHLGPTRASQLVVRCTSPLPDLMGNKNQILQALLNLVRNAEDAVASAPAQRQQIVLDVQARRDVLCISVADRGPGVPETLRARVFDPFFSTKTAGTGLGLTVVQSVAAGHGGRIEVQETPGGGATFELLLPVWREEPSTAAGQHAAKKAPTPTGLRGARVLVADDEVAIRKVIQRVGERSGAEFVAVGDADAAIVALREQGPFQLLLLDVRMPGGGGPAVFRYLQQHAPRLVPRTVFMSGELSLEMNEVRGSGYFAILPKPFRIDELRDLLERALRPVAHGDLPSAEAAS